MPISLTGKKLMISSIHCVTVLDSMYIPSCVYPSRGHTDAVLCLQFDKMKVVSGSKDKTIKVTWKTIDYGFYYSWVYLAGRGRDLNFFNDRA